MNGETQWGFPCALDTADEDKDAYSTSTQILSLSHSFLPFSLISCLSFIAQSIKQNNYVQFFIVILFVEVCFAMKWEWEKRSKSFPSFLQIHFRKIRHRQI